MEHNSQLRNWCITKKKKCRRNKQGKQLPLNCLLINSSYAWSLQNLTSYPVAWDFLDHRWALPGLQTKTFLLLSYNVQFLFSRASWLSFQDRLESGPSLSSPSKNAVPLKKRVLMTLLFNGRTWKFKKEGLEPSLIRKRLDGEEQLLEGHDDPLRKGLNLLHNSGPTWFKSFHKNWILVRINTKKKFSS